MSAEISPHPESSFPPLSSEVRAALARVEFPVGAWARRALDHLVVALDVPDSGVRRVIEMVGGGAVRRMGGVQANVNLRLPIVACRVREVPGICRHVCAVTVRDTSR